MTTETTKVTDPTANRDTGPATQIDTAGLTQNLTAPAGPTSPHCAADAARAMTSTGAWQPRLDRRQSWNSQEYKHEMQKAIQMQREGKPQSGFTERA